MNVFSALPRNINEPTPGKCVGMCVYIVNTNKRINTDNSREANNEVMKPRIGRAYIHPSK